MQARFGVDGPMASLFDTQSAVLSTSLDRGIPSSSLSFRSKRMKKIVDFLQLSSLSLHFSGGFSNTAVVGAS